MQCLLLKIMIIILLTTVTTTASSTIISKKCNKNDDDSYILDIYLKHDFPQPAFTWSKLTTETLEQGVKYVQS